MKKTPTADAGMTTLREAELDAIAADLREERNCGFWNQDRGRLFCDDRGMKGDSGHREVCQCKADVRKIAAALAASTAPRAPAKAVLAASSDAGGAE